MSWVGKVDSHVTVVGRCGEVGGGRAGDYETLQERVEFESESPNLEGPETKRADWDVPEGEGDDAVESDEEQALEPVGLAVDDEQVDEEDGDEEDNGLEVL